MGRFKIRNIDIENALLLAPMEDVTDIGYRKLCKELGADVVYTEFVNSDGLIRSNQKTRKKMIISEAERPVGIQIYGGNLEPMIEAAIISADQNPDIIDINAGCWVKKIATRGAGAGLLKDLNYLEKMVAEIVKAVKLPVTVKTRIGWDSGSINILEVAKIVENAGAEAITIHCRTRCQGHTGDPDWSWIPKVKDIVRIPVVLNGGVFTGEDVLRAFDQTGADGVMIARGAINHPWVFRDAKELLKYGKIITDLTAEERIFTALKHLKYQLEIKETKAAVIPFRKYYSGYLKGLYNSSKVRQELMKYIEYEPVEEILLKYLEELKIHQATIEEGNSDGV